MVGRGSRLKCQAAEFPNSGSRRPRILLPPEGCFLLSPVSAGAVPVTRLAGFPSLSVTAEAFGGRWGSRRSGHRCHLCLLLATKVNHQVWSQGISVSCPWASSLQQGDVIRKVIVLVAQAAEAAPLAHHEAERQHEEGTDGGHDVGYGHEGGLICLGDVVATVFHVGGDERAFHCCCPELVMHWRKDRYQWAPRIIRAVGFMQQTELADRPRNQPLRGP